MNIWQIYELQAKRAKQQFGDVVSEARIFFLASGEPLKLRLEIVDGSIVDIYLSITGRYSYHWERRLVDTNWSLWLDCKILAKTVMKVVRGGGW